MVGKKEREEYFTDKFKFINLSENQFSCLFNGGKSTFFQRSSRKVNESSGMKHLAQCLAHSVFFFLAFHLPHM